MPGEHRTQRQQDWRVSALYQAEKIQSGRAVRMRRFQLQIHARHLPEEACPDEEPEIPAQAQELKHGHADESRPPAGEPRVQLPIRCRGIPAVHVERHLIAPYERDAYRVHENDQQQLRHDRVAQPQGRSNGRVESRALCGGDEAVCHEALHDRGQLPVNPEFRQQQQGRRDQQAHMRFHVLQERQRHAASPGVPFGDRQQQQRHPHDEDRDEHAPTRELQRISGKPRASPEPVERSAAHEGELAGSFSGASLAPGDISG